MSYYTDLDNDLGAEHEAEMDLLLTKKRIKKVQSVNKSKTVVINCENCGRPKTVRLADRKRGWGRFCDKSCKAHKQAERR